MNQNLYCMGLLKKNKCFQKSAIRSVTRPEQIKCKVKIRQTRAMSRGRVLITKSCDPFVFVQPAATHD